MTLGLILLAVSPPALAHVVLQQSEARAGANYKAVFGVPHGCDGSATVSIRVLIPEGVIGVKPMPKPGWTLTTLRGSYVKSYQFYHGVALSEGVKEVVWSGGRLLDEHYDEFVLSAFVAADFAAGAVVPWTVHQFCERGDQSWSEVAKAGQSSHELKFPAPTLKISTATASASAARVFKAGALTIEAPWTRASPAGATTAAGYFTIRNSAQTADRLVAGRFDAANQFELHETVEVDGVMQMRRLDKGIEIAPGGSVELRPGGMHAMLVGLKMGLVEGGSVRGALVFEKAGLVEVEYVIAAIGAQRQGHSHH